METRRSHSSFPLSEDIRFREVQVLIELLKTKSVRELARKLGVSPGQISKQVKVLELKLGIQLLDRSTYGVEATPEAVEILPYLEDIHALHLKMVGELKPEKRENFLCFASSSFLSTHLLPKVLSDYVQKSPQTRFRMIDLPPSQFVPVALRGGFQLCVHVGDLEWPKTWTSIEVGSVIWGLYCRKDHPLSKRPGLNQILQYPFVYPVYWSSEGMRNGEDNCPVPIRKRKLGHETATAASAVEIVRFTDQLGFFPSLVCRPLVERSEIRNIKVKGWKEVSQKLFLTVKNDFIKQSTFLSLKDLIQKEMALPPSPGA